MPPHHVDLASRRRFLQFLAASRAPASFQLDTTQRREIAEALRSGRKPRAPVIVVTLDVKSFAKWITFARLRIAISIRSIDRTGVAQTAK
jgi:hypothetical protein